MTYKIKTPLKKIGGSNYALIPSSLYQQLELNGDVEVLAEFEKYRDIIKELCINFNETSEDVTLTTKDDKELIGVIAFINKTSINYMSEGQSYVVPFTHIKNISPLKAKGVSEIGEVKEGEAIGTQNGMSNDLEYLSELKSEGIQAHAVQSN